MCKTLKTLEEDRREALLNFLLSFEQKNCTDTTMADFRELLNKDRNPPKETWKKILKKKIGLEENAAEMWLRELQKCLDFHISTHGYRSTALHWVSTEGHYDMAEYLVIRAN